VQKIVNSPPRVCPPTYLTYPCLPISVPRVHRVCLGSRVCRVRAHVFFSLSSPSPSPCHLSRLFPFVPPFPSPLFLVLSLFVCLAPTSKPVNHQYLSLLPLPLPLSPSSSSRPPFAPPPPPAPPAATRRRRRRRRPSRPSPLPPRCSHVSLPPRQLSAVRKTRRRVYRSNIR
jgi:hypothetical protein